MFSYSPCSTQKFTSHYTTCLSPDTSGQKGKAEWRVTDMYMSYAHLQGIYVFFKSKKPNQTHATPLDHSAVSTNSIFGNMQSMSPPLTSTSLTPAVLLYTRQAMSTVASSSLTSYAGTLCPFPSPKHPSTIPSPMSLTCLWLTDQTWGSTCHDRFRAKCTTTSWFPNTLLASSAWLARKPQQKWGLSPPCIPHSSVLWFHYLLLSPAEPSARSCCRIAWT